MSSRIGFDSALYTSANIDWAMQRAADDFNRITGGSRTVGTLTLTAGSTDLPSPPSDWSPSQHLQQTLLCNGQQVDPNIQFVDYNTLLTAMWANGTTNEDILTSSTCSSPIMFAYKDESTGKVFPAAPTTGYTIEYWYWLKFTSWTPGQAILTANTNTLGAITSVSVVSGGYYVDSTATLTVSGGSGSGATLTATVQAGVIASVSVGAAGSGYTSPVISVNGSSAANITFNLPDEALRIIISDGVQGYLQNIEPQNAALAKASLERFEKNARAYSGRNAGGRGGQIWVADLPSSYPPQYPYAFGPLV